ncbi:cAMP-specific 3',5'-cyclic phosphodiesterase 7B [Eumeta japonica]|uniref:cAMP-specific 3',5'-cyclic phosphodiesterase 7B n=1 Tax=Eumeta variegata TaxID=151549 RepID=A0A4C2ACW0_EUMVA|nr:cAMP-specific 3',5'-cyclic phosphodiesterase 7B [Eumeta japonica]
MRYMHIHGKAASTISGFSILDLMPIRTLLENRTFSFDANEIRDHLEPLEIMSSLIAAIAHDVDHPGVNQPFLIATSNHLAALYKRNDFSVVRGRKALTASPNTVEQHRGSDARDCPMRDQS